MDEIKITKSLTLGETQISNTIIADGRIDGNMYAIGFYKPKESLEIGAETTPQTVGDELFSICFAEEYGLSSLEVLTKVCLRLYIKMKYKWKPSKKLNAFLDDIFGIVKNLDALITKE